MLLGARLGYPIFRETFEVDVLVDAARRRSSGCPRRSVVASAPTVPGRRPGAALLIVRRGPKGNVLTVQPLADEGPAPQAVPIGGGWTSGRTGYLYTVSESVPALAIRSEEVDATFLFANTRERDRIAALVAVAR